MVNQNDIDPLSRRRIDVTSHFRQVVVRIVYFDVPTKRLDLLLDAGDVLRRKRPNRHLHHERDV